MNKDTISNLIEHSGKIELLVRYTKFLQKEGYLDTDATCEAPTAIDQFIESERRTVNRGGKVSKETIRAACMQIPDFKTRRYLTQAIVAQIDNGIEEIKEVIKRIEKQARTNKAMADHLKMLKELNPRTHNIWSYCPGCKGEWDNEYEAFGCPKCGFVKT